MASGAHFSAHPNSVQPNIYATFQDAPSKSLCGRFSLNWEKVVFIAKVAVVLSGIAAAFFMKLPMMMLGLGVYGILDVILHIGVGRQKNKASQEELYALRDKVGKQESTLTRIRRERDNALKENKKLRGQVEAGRYEREALVTEKDDLQGQLDAQGDGESA